jgi:dephospho-CoA kinase
MTGGVASGKSTVSQAFARLGVPVIDTDDLAREVVAPGTEGLEAVRGAFGHEVITDDGQVNRRALRDRIFADPAARDILEAITHPRIAALVAQRLDAMTAPYAIVVVPLLLEAGWEDGFDRILLVDAAPADQKRRLMQRDDLDEAAACRMIESQASGEQRRAIADDIIDNRHHRAALETQVLTLDRRYRDLAARRSPPPFVPTGPSE